MHRINCSPHAAIGETPVYPGASLSADPRTTVEDGGIQVEIQAYAETAGPGRPRQRVTQFGLTAGPQSPLHPNPAYLSTPPNLKSCRQPIYVPYGVAR